MRKSDTSPKANLDINSQNQIQTKQKPSKIATRVVRFANWFIDFFIGIVPLFLFAGYLVDYYIWYLLGPDFHGIGLIILFLILVYFYYFISENYFRKTIGQLFTKTEVVSATNNVVTKKQIRKRSFLRLLPFDFVTFFISPVGLHDFGSKTYVIQK